MVTWQNRHIIGRAQPVPRKAVPNVAPPLPKNGKGPRTTHSKSESSLLFLLVEAYQADVVGRVTSRL